MNKDDQDIIRELLKKYSVDDLYNYISNISYYESDEHKTIVFVKEDLEKKV